MKNRLNILSLAILLIFNNIGCVVSESIRGLWTKKEKEDKLLYLATGLAVGQTSSKPSDTGTGTNTGRLALHQLV